MRLTEFIDSKEFDYSMSPDDMNNFNKMLQQLEISCKEIITFYKANPGKFLYRGSIKGTDYVSNATQGFAKSPPENRDPMNTNMRVHRIAIKYMTELGFAAHRGNSVFVTSSERESRRYGPPYIIFPKDGFQFTWSQRYRDFYHSEPGEDSPVYKSAKAFQEFFKFTRSNLLGAINEQHEIMIAGPYYRIKLGLADSKLGRSIQEHLILKWLGIL